jgi:DNA-binding MarR family transcriptional regulator
MRLELMARDATEPELIEVVVRLPRATVERSLRVTNETDALPRIAYPSMAKAILASRSHRRQRFGGIRFGEPAWDMILELYVASARGHAPNVSKLCAAGGRSMTTGLRHLEELEAAGYVRRQANDGDARSNLVVIQPTLRQAVEAWLDDLADMWRA